MDPELTTRNFEVRYAWDESHDGDAELVNQFSVVSDGTGYYITLGHAAPPMDFGQSALEGPIDLTVKKRASIFLTPNAMVQFHQLLSQHVEALIAQQNQTAGPQAQA